MCGIAGIWHLNNTRLDLDKLRVFTDSMLERGPDGAGYSLFDNETLGLGHRRLSILDLTDAGKQPMSYLDGRYHITYNGEVFNFAEIREELEVKGYKFISDTDTEVILAAYDAWGRECLNRFNGMWAFAIWDEREKTLFMARDRFGIKPFYYIHKPGQILAFASETRAFKHLEGYSRSLDEKMVELQMQGARIHGSGYSIFKGVYSILPGHYCIVRRDDQLQQKRWWHIQDYLRTDIPSDLHEQAEEYYSLLRDACKIRLVSDVPVATALSGGLDSSSVYSIVNDLIKGEKLSRVPQNSQKAVVVTFPGLENDERLYAEKTIAYTAGEALFLPQEYPNLAEQITKDTIHFDGLNASPITAISGIYRGMRQNGIAVSLDGHGVDEMMYGYRDMMYNLFDYYFKSGNKTAANMLRSTIVPTYADNEQQRVRANLESMMKSASSPLSGMKKLAKKILRKNELNRADYRSSNLWEPLGEPYDFSYLSYPERILYNETFVETLPDIFRNFDIAGMMNSVEIRMPFMDWRLVAYTFSLSIESKIGNGYNKLILREAMKNRMAEDIRSRTLKIGISSPVASWLKTDLNDWAKDIISSSSFDWRNQTKPKEIGDIDLSNANVARKAWWLINLNLIDR